MFSIVDATTDIPTKNVQESSAFDISCLFYDGHLIGMRLYVTVILFAISLIISDVGHFFMYLVAIFISLEKYLLEAVVHLFIFLFCSVLFTVNLGVPYHILNLISYQIYFLPFYRFQVHSIDYFFCFMKVFNLI